MAKGLSTVGRSTVGRSTVRRSTVGRSTVGRGTAQISSDVSQNEQLTVGFQRVDSYVIHVVCYGLPSPKSKFWRGPRQHPRNILTI